MIYAWLWDRLDEQGRESFLAELSSPLPGQPEIETQAMIEEEGAGFMALLSKTRGSGA